MNVDDYTQFGQDIDHALEELGGKQVVRER